MASLWSNESYPGYGAVLHGRIPYLTDEQNARAERIRQARLLFEGKHRQYFLDEHRTQCDFPEMEINGVVRRPYFTLKMLRLLSYKGADLIFGEKAALTVDDQIKRMYLDALVTRSKVHARFHASAVQASWAGGAALLSTLWRDKSYLLNVQPEEIFPVGPMNPDDQYESYVQYREACVGPEDKPVRLLLKVEFGRTQIVRNCFQLDDDRNLGREVDLKLWPGPEAAFEPAESTGISENLITWLPNEIEGRHGVSDYDGLITSQDGINGACSQIARVVAKHSDPFVAIPNAAFAPDGTFRVSNKAISFDTREQIPEYVVWDAQMAAAIQDRKFRLDGLCIEAEMSQVLLGIKEGGAPDAARKLRLEATNALAKAKRKTLSMEPAIIRALEVALMLDRDARTASVSFSFDTSLIGVEMHDGLPIDDLDEANIISTLRSANAMSLEDAVERRKRDPQATAEEVARIRKEESERAAAATPPFLLGEPATNLAPEPPFSSNSSATANENGGAE